MKVLVVDDNLNARKLLVKVLASNNYETDEATNGKEALEVLRNSKPDLIISDIMMPVMDGFTLIKETKTNPETEKIPFVFYTAHYVSEKDHLLATSLGASRFIVKPVEPQELLQEIQNVLDEYEAGELKPAGTSIETEEEYFKEYSQRIFRKLEEKYSELEKTKNFLDTVLKTMDECVVAVDPKLNITYYNHKVEGTMGCDFKIGEKLPHFIVPYDNDLKFVSYDAFETRMTDKDKKTVYLDGTVSPTVSERGECTGYILVFKDVTERKQAEKELLNAKWSAESTSKAKTEFLSNVSHELRTPLTAIIGYSDILGMMVSGDLNDKQLGYVNHINESGKNLLAIVNDILDTSNIKAGNMELKCEIFPVAEVFSDVLNRVEPKRSKKNIDIQVENNILVDEIFADRMKFKLALSNILSNAIKFTPNNGTVKVVAEKNDYEIHVSVSDSGIGIPENRMADIFDPFVQVDSSNNRKYGGTGLGLALTKWFVELHDGTICVNSEEDKGSTFSFTMKDQGRCK